MGLGWQAWFTLGILVLMVVALVREMARTELVLLGSLGLLLLAGIVPPDIAFAGFSNSAVLTVAALFVVAAGVQQTNALSLLDRFLFNRSGHHTQLIPRLMVPTSFLSAFLNNTPIVAMLIPKVQQWAVRQHVPASKLLIPLSYAAILGGMCTLIGTSTNIVVSGLMEAEGYEGFGMFDLTWVGIPAVIGIVIFFVLVGHRLLPRHQQDQEVLEDGLTDCLFAIKVGHRAYAIGMTVEEAGLRALGDAYLVHIHRGHHFLPATPDETILAGDELTFVGDPDVLDDLLQRPGLKRSVSGLEGDTHLPLFEAVVASSSSLVGHTLKEVDFRDHFGGVVLAIHRRDEQYHASLGTTPIQSGDLLLIEARPGFDERWNARRDEFYLVASRRLEAKTIESHKAPLALLLFVGMVVLVALKVLPIVTASFAAALAMVATRCVRIREARQAVDVGVLLVIAAALGIGQAVERTGLVDVMAQGLMAWTLDLGVLAILFVLYIVTNLLTELITHKAAAVLMLPVALAMATAVGAPPKAFALLVAVAAAASFITPIGYQTNLMVMSAGGYRFKDYFKVGLPVSLIVMVIAVTMIQWVWL